MIDTLVLHEFRNLKLVLLTLRKLKLALIHT
jgi:hypothetical protein